MDSLKNLLKTTLATIDENLSSEKGKLNFGPLRDFGRSCIDEALKNDNSKNQFLSFFLYLYLENYFENFSIDTPYDSDIQVFRIDFYVEFRNLIDSLLSAIERNDYESIMKSFSNSIGKYLHNINYLNKVL